VPRFSSSPTTGDMADIHPLNDPWPEKLPYQKQSLVLPGPGKPGHSGAFLAVEFGAIRVYGNTVFLQTFTGTASLLPTSLQHRMFSSPSITTHSRVPTDRLGRRTDVHEPRTNFRPGVQISRPNCPIHRLPAHSLDKPAQIRRPLRLVDLERSCKAETRRWKRHRESLSFWGCDQGERAGDCRRVECKHSW
jgi:hypothetical protein